MTQPTPRRKKASRRAWSYKAGGKGRNRVRVFEWNGAFWIDYREDGKRRRQALRHTDRERARQLADEIARTLGTLQGAALPSALTLGTLFDMYEREKTPAKVDGKQGHDRYIMKLARACWGSTTLVGSLDRRDWDRFIQMRRAGTLGKKSADGTIETDLRMLMSMLNWALSVRVKGQPLLARNPFVGFPVPKEASPRQPVLSEEDYLKLVAVAPLVHKRCPLFLLLAHETGHRSKSIGLLRWSDVDFPKRSITWRPENDKKKFGHQAPISDVCVEALRRAQLEEGAIGDRPIFPHHEDPSQSITENSSQWWWRRLEQLSGIDVVPGLGWHSLRRKFATEHMDQPMRVLMKLGGWQNMQTILRYQKPQEEQLRAALESRSQRRANG